ncbi:hypothetical protein PGT21_030741 [Puccinia graminis f. sp. tritici]|uniref:Uncharacterized protein n=1 Tax=Puccinia graminis f. sp. tritici TaxID=56615 RepID=A0A5B0MST3_PUCGR|nr:hypothetical protein PGTUg99_016834 [Puccinia graminis f. sp. tritici]KAA1094809.1 hypothetical protein PGT21_030741 [Puccinia graminis f. sp. tritici]
MHIFRSIVVLISVSYALAEEDPGPPINPTRFDCPPQHTTAICASGHPETGLKGRAAVRNFMGPTCVGSGFPNCVCCVGGVVIFNGAGEAFVPAEAFASKKCTISHDHH